MQSTRKPFKFVDPKDNGNGFKLVVFAYSEQEARKYVKSQAASSLTHRRLKFVGAGYAPDPQNWTAASTPLRKGN